MFDLEYDAFENFHPLVNFTYFTAVLVFSMFFMHPILQLISLFGALSYFWILRGIRERGSFSLGFLLFILFATAVMNPLFNHQGASILFYLRSGNPVTLESIIYGLSAALMFVTVIIWFSSYNAVMTSDKFMHLFGRIIPSLSLVFSMVLRFVPRYREQIGKISDAQKNIGRDMSQGTIIQRAKNGMKILSIMITWALENSIETADSMRSRGYGLAGRTSFSNFRFDKRDGLAFSSMIGLIFIILYGAYKGVNTIKFFPVFFIQEISGLSILVYLAYFLLCMLPIIINIQEAIQWNYIESRN